MTELIYIDYAIKLLEAAKKTKRKIKKNKRGKRALREGILGSVVEKVKGFFKAIINKAKSLLAKIVGDGADKITSKTSNRFTQILNLSRNPAIGHVAMEEFADTIVLLKERLKSECDKPECKDAINKAEYLLSKMREVKKQSLMENVVWDYIKTSALDIGGHIRKIAFITGIFLVYDAIKYLYKRIKGNNEEREVENYESEVERGRISKLVKHILGRVKKASKVYLILVLICIILFAVLYVIAPDAVEYHYYRYKGGEQ